MSSMIAIVDDDENTRELVRVILESSGFSIQEFSSAATLVDDLRREPFDLILMDYQMPDVDGLTALRALRQARMTVPVIMLTASADQKVAVECFRAGANDFISKPFDPEYLSFVAVRAIERGGVNLRDVMVRLLRYARHADDCVRGDGTCSCSMMETVQAAADALNYRGPKKGG